MKCLKCGKQLRNEESIKLGMDPVCYKSLFPKKKKRKKNDAIPQDDYTIPGQMEIRDFLKV